MARIVADTSALVSLGTVADRESSPIDVLLESHDVVVPERVIGELRDTADYDDAAGESAQAVLDRGPSFDARSVDLDEAFPLDDGENAAVALANETSADWLLCDEFNQLALVHASLADTRLLTTPSVLLALVRNRRLEPRTAEDLLDAIGDARSWESNAYVARARATLDRERE